MAPDTPSEVHNRVYTRGIQPLVLDARALTEELVGELLATILTPADLTIHPTTFGPNDDDPMYPILATAKEYRSTDYPNETLQVSAGKDALRAAYESLKRHQGRNIVQRLKEIDSELGNDWTDLTPSASPAPLSAPTVSHPHRQGHR